MTRLYRASGSDIMTGPTSFAASLDDAVAYTDNPGFGGPSLYCCDVDLDYSSVLDIRSPSDTAQVETLVSLTGVDLGSADTGMMLADSRVVDALVSLGYEWVRLIDTYPDDCETYTWLYAGDEPELIEIS